MMPISQPTYFQLSYPNELLSLHESRDSEKLNDLLEVTQLGRGLVWHPYPESHILLPGWLLVSLPPLTPDLPRTGPGSKGGGRSEVLGPPPPAMATRCSTSKCFERPRGSTSCGRRSSTPSTSWSTSTEPPPSLRGGRSSCVMSSH